MSEWKLETEAVDEQYKVSQRRGKLENSYKVKIWNNKSEWSTTGSRAQNNEKIPRGS